ncbi:MAG: hypothetical protein AAF543_24090 [Pseudomonadota bacterium]
MSDTSAEAERLLKRLTIALDLHGHRGISEREIMEAHADTPTALLGKLSHVVDRCNAVSHDLEGFHAALPDLRKAFLEATNIPAVFDAAEASAVDDDVSEAQAISASTTDWAEADRVEESIDLSVRELWRKLWFRTAVSAEANVNRWAVIVASPPDADRGWDQLGKHQRRWIDAYFQLHEPYYESNPHHAIVVGRRLPEDQATRLRDYVVELGMADDAYLWALPYDGVGPADGSEDDGLVGERSEQEDRLEQLGRDLTGLN